MPAVITVEEAQANLKDIIDHLAPGDEFIITKNEKPVAKLVGQTVPARKPRRAGSAQGKLTIVKEDDEHLKDFAEYMP
jgi:prevent-host-death family protein